MKRLLLLAILIIVTVSSAKAYDHSEVSPSGHTLYYNIVNGHAEVVRPGTSSSYYNYVTGDLIIPDSVFYQYEKRPVQVIGTDAFYHCDSLTSVSLPSGITQLAALLSIIAAG